MADGTTGNHFGPATIPYERPEHHSYPQDGPAAYSRRQDPAAGTKWASPFVPGHSCSGSDWLPLYVEHIIQHLQADLHELCGCVLVCDCPLGHTRGGRPCRAGFRGVSSRPSTAGADQAGTPESKPVGLSSGNYGPRWAPSNCR